MAWGAFANLIPQLPDFAGAGMNFAIGNMNRSRYASQVRHLRRREYQDMMYSMKAAGLNPMLASGATPGHSAAFSPSQGQLGGSAGIGDALANISKANSAKKMANAEAAKIDVERENRMYERARVLGEIDLIKSQQDLNAKMGWKAEADASASTNLGLKYLSEIGLVNANAKLSDQRGKGENFLNQVRALDAEIAGLPEAKTAKRMQLWAETGSKVGDAVGEFLPGKGIRGTAGQRVPPNSGRTVRPGRMPMPQRSR